MALIDTINSISSIMDELIDFSVNDEYLSIGFEDFLIKNNIDTERQSEIQNCLIEYILDEKTKDNTRVLDYFIQKNPSSNVKIVNALKNSFISIFQVKKILKNAYRAFCLSNEKEFELIPLVKMTNLRGIGLFDFIKARMIEIDGVFYLLEIFDCFGEIREHIANAETIRCLVKYPESQIMYNDEKLLELQKSTKMFNDKFLSAFGRDEIITSNTLADEFIKDFNLMVENIDIKGFSSEKYNEEFPIGFFNQEEDEEEDFLKNATGGFSNSPVPYDIGFFADKDSGLYIVPFLGTFNEILKSGSLDDIEYSKECVQYILNSDKVSANLLVKKNKEFKDFIKIVNLAFDKEFKDIREIIGYFKEDWISKKKFSPTMALYNSKTFEKMIKVQNDMVESN